MAVFGTSAGRMGIWKYPFCRSSFEKNLEPAILAEKSATAGRGYLSGTVAVLRQRKSPQGLQVPSGLGTIWRGLDHREEERQTIPAFFILRNSALGETIFSGSKRQALSKTGGPGAVGRLWNTPWLGVETKNPSEERTSGYYDRSFRISLGVCCRCAQNGSKAAGEERLERTSRESASKTLALATSTSQA